MLHATVELRSGVMIYIRVAVELEIQIEVIIVVIYGPLSIFGDVVSFFRSFFVATFHRAVWH